jgi:diaminopimelate epimerase
MRKRIRLQEREVNVSFVDTGSPHVVVPCSLLGNVKALKKLDVNVLGREIRNHAAFRPAGTNANFIERAGRNSIRVRTYERGVEAETMACGTGSIASAIIASRLWNLKPPITVIAASGRKLQVEFAGRGSKPANIRLIGPAIITFNGLFEL